MRRAAKIDANQPDIVQALKQQGCSVAITSSAHDGFPDLVVGYKGITVLTEVKDGTLPPSKRKLTPKQVEFHNEFTGAIVILQSIDDVVQLVSKMRQAAQLIRDIQW